MPTAEDILAKTSGRTAVVWVCPDAGLYSRWQEAEQAYEQAKRHTGGTLGDSDDAADLKAEAEALAEQVDGSLVEIKLTEARPGKVRALKSDHALSKKEAEKRGLRPGMLDEVTFWPALLAESASDPQFTLEQAGELLDASEMVRAPIVTALDQLHGGAGDPKAAVTIARRRSAGSSSTPPQS